MDDNKTLNIRDLQELTSERLLFRDWQDSDLDFLQKLRNDVRLQAKLLSTALGSDLRAVKMWLGNKSSDGKMFFVVEAKELSEPIGYLQVAKEAGAENCFRFGVCLDNHYKSQGLGKEILRWLEQFLLHRKSANKIILSVDAENTLAISCYAKTGYREVGIHKKHLRVNNVWRDVVVMEKLLKSIDTKRELI